MIIYAILFRTGYIKKYNLVGKIIACLALLPLDIIWTVIWLLCVTFFGIIDLCTLVIAVTYYLCTKDREWIYQSTLKECNWCRRNIFIEDDFDFIDGE